MEKFLAFLLLFGISQQPLHSEESEKVYDRVSLTMDASREVENDTLEALLFYQRQGDNAGKLAVDVNNTITKAVKLAKNTSEVSVQTLGYQTNPIYSKQVLTGWRVKQSIRLKSQNAAVLSSLISKLQKTLAIESINYNISENRRRSAEGELIAEAIKSFQERAQLIAKNLGRSDFRLVKMDVNTQRVSPRPIMRTLAISAESSRNPSLEAGTQTVRVIVNGTIELIVH